MTNYKHKPGGRPAKNVRLDLETIDALKEYAEGFETVNQCLRRILNLDDDDQFVITKLVPDEVEL